MEARPTSNWRLGSMAIPCHPKSRSNLRVLLISTPSPAPMSKKKPPCFCLSTCRPAVLIAISHTHQCHVHMMGSQEKKKPSLRYASGLRGLDPPLPETYLQYP
eukprot:7290356-Pyramimonas_sp.AAC.2